MFRSWICRLCRLYRSVSLPRMSTSYDQFLGSLLLKKILEGLLEVAPHVCILLKKTQAWEWTEKFQATNVLGVKLKQAMSTDPCLPGSSLLKCSHSSIQDRKSDHSKKVTHPTLSNNSGGGGTRSRLFPPKKTDQVMTMYIRIELTSPTKPKI